MKINLFILYVVLLTICTQIFFTNKAIAYVNEVRQVGANYVWRVNNIDQGTTANFTDAVTKAVWEIPPIDNREVHILASGTLTTTIGLPFGVKLYCHNQTFTISHGGLGFYGKGVNNVQIHDVTLTGLTNMGIRMTRCSNLVFNNIRILSGFIGIRVDSHESRPWDGFWVYGLTVTNCRFENLGSHGLETYAVDGFSIDNIIARNNGECGVLLNQSINGTVGAVDAYRCCLYGGYAGLRLANGCSNITTNSLIARECGRGYFVTSGSNNCYLNNAQIIDCIDNWGTGRAIWLENVANCTVVAGCCNTGISVGGTGSYANVSTTCSTAVTYYKIQNRATGLVLDGMGRTVNGNACGQYASATSSYNAQWERIYVDGAFRFRNRGTGLLLDGMGRTTNGLDLGQWAFGTVSYNAQWWFQPTDGGYFRLQNRGTNFYIDGMGRTANGSNAGQWASDVASYSQQWKLITVSGPALAKTIQTVEPMVIKEELSSITVFPNPAINEITIKLPTTEVGNKTAQLYDAFGRVVASNTFNSTPCRMYIGNLPIGTYILKIECNKKFVTSKVIKR